ncbi:MAG: gluconate 2-dehydrogenase subunit 3 family protein [Gemmatimonadetes bacterium]|nr:gluconate 2-dehydrogenase subunit 3 family protein [Gemmatimonadota bacterium]MBK7351431.1 gluconate 2-dehydrogenase subunit 3 family protein [Gemmatimonadota bacterium]MBK7716057.1 gluconate 2-dehydrogenase subunit 3 family protein [Gemmatimonadota bacterium]MBK7786594.1 gluconate 2-dehydrogenase subunit 3 family protein [Gemmatimonadota bacterium]MBK7922950.1 gluconate 2-dehydrogenase subunit 3 family protein [Gemmatimonadota bacterium]
MNDDAVARRLGASEPEHPTRREALAALAAVPLVAAGFSPAEVHRAATAAREALRAAAFTPVFFTDHEYATVRMLAELVIPRDGRSGGALDAGVPEFMDFILDENKGMQTWMRGGLAWLDTEARERFGRAFGELADAQRRAILDDIAWPRRARPEHSQGVAFFNRFRDLTASGFFSSEIGVRDLRYQGNEFVMEWQGCPPEALRKLGVSYD